MKLNANGAVSVVGSGLIWGVIVSIITTLLGAALSAALISTEMVPEKSADYCAMVILLISAMAGAFVGAGKTKEKRLYICGLIGVIYLLVLLGMTALFFDGKYEGVGVTALVIFAGCIGMALLGVGGRKRSKLRKSKIRHR